MMKRRNTRYWAVTAVGIALAHVLVFQVPEFMAFQGDASNIEDASNTEDADTSPLVIYFSDGVFVSEKRIENGAAYIPAIELVQRLGIPFIDDPADGLLSIRGPGGTVEVAHNSNTITVDGGEVQLNWPSFRQDGRWWVPMEFLTLGASEITGIRFRYDDDAPRVFAGDQATTLLDMNATQTDAGTRLTIRAGTSIDVQIQQNQNQVVLSIDGNPIAPTREVLEYEDNRVRLVRFDDGDGNAKVVIETGSPQVRASLTSIDQNRTYFVDLAEGPATVDVATRATSPTRDVGTTDTPVRVIVIDPGHGGLDNGASAHGTLEKDLAMALARQLRAAIESRFDATIILTRDGDRALTHEDRASIANNSQADLLISLHVGYSLDPTESSASLFVMDPPSENTTPQQSTNAFFQPWYRAYATNRDRSREFADTLHENLDQAIPSWEFPVRHAPVGVLVSTAMPGVVLELGNANNEVDLINLTDQAFQDRIIGAILDAIEDYDGANAPGTDR